MRLRFIILVFGTIIISLSIVGGASMTCGSYSWNYNKVFVAGGNCEIVVGSSGGGGGTIGTVACDSVFIEEFVCDTPYSDIAAIGLRNEFPTPAKVTYFKVCATIRTNNYEITNPIYHASSFTLNNGVARWFDYDGGWHQRTLVCVCAPKTCSELNFECGIQDDGCGGTIDCGTCISGYTCSNGICIVEGTCSDTDGGINYDVKGTVTFNDATYTDWCSTNHGSGGSTYSCEPGPNCELIEQYCVTPSGGVGFEIYQCPYGCRDRACRPDCASRDSYSCYDNDVYWYDSCGDIEEKKEECYDGTTNGIWEDWYCEDGDTRKRDRINTVKGCLGDSCYVNLVPETEIVDCETGEICLSGECIQETALTGGHWRNMINTPINTADLNDLVKLMVFGRNLEGVEVEYIVYENIPWWINSKVMEISTEGFITWRAGKKDDGTLSKGEYYFLAKIQGEITQIDSRDTPEYGMLVVSDTEDNTPPVANITSPQVGEIYFTGEDVEFNQSSYDEDDEIASVLWDFGDGETSIDDSDIHTYSTTKQKQIKLTVTDERNAEDEDRTSILIISQEDNDYVFAHIDEPEWGDNFFGYEVYFSAESSYGLGVSGCPSCTIDCLGGKCPALAGGPQPYDALTFSWKFDGGSSGVKKAGGDPGKNFTWIFGHPGKHNADLTVSMD